MSSGMGPLDLSSADLKGFDAVDPGRYVAEVFEMTMDATKNPGGKTPVGTPMLKIQFKLLSDSQGNSEGIENRRAFTQYVIPPADYDPKKAATMKGMIARFFIALGWPEEKVVSKKFDFDNAMEEAIGRQCVIVLGREPKLDRDKNVIEGEFNNPVKGVKHIDTLNAAAAASSGLL